jgi:N-methylhydantoinase B
LLQACRSLVQEARLRELVGKYGEAAVVRMMNGLQDYSERMMPARLRGLPKGTYRFEHVLEHERRGKWR